MTEHTEHVTEHTGATADEADGRMDLRGLYTPDEVTELLTGFDEIAIERATGRTIEAMSNEKDPRTLQLMRALGAVILARSNGTKIEAEYHGAVMPMPQRDVVALFAPDEPAEDEIVPGESDSDAGKGDTPGENAT